MVQVLDVECKYIGIGGFSIGYSYPNGTEKYAERSVH